MRFSKVVILLIVGTLLLSACGTATPTTADEMTDSGQRFLLSLPRLVVDIDEAGNFSIGGIGIDELSELTGMQMPPMAMNPYYVDWMKHTNVQHVELVHTDNGIFLYVNGDPLPYLAWDGESLANVGDVAGMANVPFSQLIGLVVPIIERTGANVVVRLPMNGYAPINLRDPAAVPEPVPADAGPTALVTHVDIDYDENGIPMLAGITTRDLINAGLGVPVELTKETLAAIKAYGIEELQMLGNDDGVFVTVNGMPLPHIAWNDLSLNQGATLYGQVNPDSPLVGLINLLLPQLNNVDFDVKVRFPTE
ncbi:MAG: hypothetical protein U9R25_01770 [Chloroflexota bacterium]|nr:hypothetical protein [Chloroflexota bacterium]